jgi:hypothetical protein
MNDLREQLDTEQRSKRAAERQKASALDEARMLAHELREDDKAVKRALKTSEMKNVSEKVRSSFFCVVVVVVVVVVDGGSVGESGGASQGERAARHRGETRDGTRIGRRRYKT